MPSDDASDFDLEVAAAWDSNAAEDVYRWIPPEANYEPTTPWPGNGRFDDGQTPTLYVGLTAEGAVAEYFRRHPELMQFQQVLKLRLFRMRISGESVGLDVSVESIAEAVGIEWERLRSSDLRSSPRYRRCQELAAAVLQAGGDSIRYPSAAFEQAVSVVFFGNEPQSWTAEVDAEMDLPWIDPDLVRPLPIGADL